MISPDTATPAAATQRLALAEFIPLMALLQSLLALAIDAILPAYTQIQVDLRVADPNALQLLVSAVFVGMTAGQILGGAASDRWGRKPVMYAGLVVFVLGSLLSLVAQSFTVLLISRLLQGFGAAIPVVVTMALVRDQYAGAPMARVMSYVGGVFILVPMIAPLLGQGVLFIATWRTIFLAFVLIAVPAGLWFALRQPETLPVERRMPLAWSRVVTAATMVFGSRVAIGYAAATGLLFGAFLNYLSTAPQVFQGIYATGPSFALLFSVLAGCIGLALFGNGALVLRLGMRRLAQTAFAGIVFLSATFTLAALVAGGKPSLLVLMLYLCPLFFCVGILFGNLDSLAMEPLGAAAGLGASIVAGIGRIIGLPIGWLLGRLFNDTVLPLSGGFAVLGALALATTVWAETGRQRLAEAVP